MSIVVNKTRLPVTEWQTKSGAVVSIDDARQRDARSLKVHMLPHQDLHGYDNPWPAGGGKNKFDPTAAVVGAYINDSTGAETTAEGSVASGYIPVVGGETYIISPQKATGNWGAWYDDGKVFISGFTGYVSAKTAPQNAKYMRITVNRNDNEPNWATVTQVELGSTATSWSPYSNICPITGWTQAKVTRTGRNLFDQSQQGQKVGSYRVVDLSIGNKQKVYMVVTDKDTSVEAPMPTNLGFVVSDYNGSKALDNTQYRWAFRNSGSPFVNRSNTNGGVSVNDGDKLCGRVLVYPNDDASWDAIRARYNIAVYSAESDTGYSPYTGTTYPVSFPAVGANQWDEEWEVGGLSGSTGEPTSSSTLIRSKNFTECVAGRSYYCYCGEGGNKFNIFWYDTNEAFIKADTFNSGNVMVKTAPSNARYFKLRSESAYGTTYLNDVSINYPSSVTSYEPYTTTVYGGTVDVTDGKMVIKYEKRTISSFTGAWGSVTNGYAVYSTQSGTDHSNVNSEYMASNMFKYYSGGSRSAPLFSYGCNDGASTTQTFILPSTITSKNEANAWLANLETPLECTFKLATPITIHLTPQQIQMLVRDNTIWSDADSVEVEYAAVHQHG